MKTVKGNKVRDVKKREIPAELVIRETTLFVFFVGYIMLLPSITRLRSFGDTMTNELERVFKEVVLA